MAVLLTCDLPRYRDAHKAFMKALVAKGYDQSNVEVITQTPNPDPISWANSIRKFNAIGANLIVTYGAPATAVAVREAADIPIVFADVYGPVEAGVAKSMQSAGKNLAGVSSKVPLVTLVKTASELKTVRSIGVLYNAREEGALVQLREMTRIATQLGAALTAVNLGGRTGVDQGLATLFAAKVDYIYVSECTAASRGFDKIVHRATEQKIPVLTLMPGGAARGALISLEADPAEQGQAAADYAARILAGRKAGQLPVITPKKVELVVNLKVARSLDLHVPFPVLAAATKVLK
ncbi:ABC transporter substrate-binding protein [Geomonas sp. Red875]|uniref:ABC transporter substrate-binding protein n=1 Tax=Geomesophilobacter sediminis TaxID=2798584 RepID=A0A8J7SAQ4_9BACT|nr:ABC transporter substrate-binding protein [Geomesophilobacter sediminis]